MTHNIVDAVLDCIQTDLHEDHEDKAVRIICAVLDWIPQASPEAIDAMGLAIIANPVSDHGNDWHGWRADATQVARIGLTALCGIIRRDITAVPVAGEEPLP